MHRFGEKATECNTMCAKPEYFPSGSRIPKSMGPAARIRQADIEKEFPLFLHQAHTNDRGRARNDLRTAVFPRLKPQRPGRPDMILRQDAHENSSGGQIMLRPQEKKKTDRPKGISSAFTRRSLITICRIIPMNFGLHNAMTINASKLHVNDFFERFRSRLPRQSRRKLPRNKLIQKHRRVFIIFESTSPSAPYRRQRIPGPRPAKG